MGMCDCDCIKNVICNAKKSCYEHRNSTDTRQSTCYIGTLYSQANIMVKMLKITYVKRQLADDSENKISFVANFWTICPFKNTGGLTL